jgi:hypothetical protein
VKRTARLFFNASDYQPEVPMAAFRAAIAAHGLRPGCYKLELVPAMHSTTRDGSRLAAWGRASIGGTWCAMLLDAARASGAGWIRWLWTLDHEVLHLKGLEHGDMKWHDEQANAAVPYHPTMEAPPLPPPWAHDLAAAGPARLLRTAASTATAAEMRPQKIARRQAQITRIEAAIRACMVREKKLTTRLRTAQRSLAALERAADHSKKGA